MRKVVFPLITALLALLSTSATAAETDFPARKDFPSIPVYELSELHKKFNDVVIVDTRSHYEFNTLRIKDHLRNSG